MEVTPYTVSTNHSRDLAGDFNIDGAPLATSVVRTELLVDVCHKLENGQSLLIMGHMGMGKTSFIKAICSRFGSEHSLFIDSLPHSGKDPDIQKAIGLYEVGSYLALLTDRSTGRNFTNTLSDQSRALDIEDWCQKIEESGVPALVYLKEYRERHGKSEPLVIALDYERDLETYPEIFEALCHLSTTPGLTFAVSFHARPRMMQLISTQGSHLEHLYLPPLCKDEVRTLIEHQLDQSGKKFDDSALDALFEVTGGRPFEIQLLAYGVLSVPVETGAAKSIFSAADIYERFRDQDFQEHQLEPARACLEQAFRDFTDAQKTQLACMVRDGAISANSENCQIFEELIATGIIELDSTERLMRIRGEFARLCFFDITAEWR